MLRYAEFAMKVGVFDQSDMEKAQVWIDKAEEKFLRRGGRGEVGVKFHAHIKRSSSVSGIRTRFHVATMIGRSCNDRILQVGSSLRRAFAKLNRQIGVG